MDNLQKKYEELFDKRIMEMDEEINATKVSLKKWMLMEERSKLIAAHYRIIREVFDDEPKMIE